MNADSRKDNKNFFQVRSGKSFTITFMLNLIVSHTLTKLYMKNVERSNKKYSKMIPIDARRLDFLQFWIQNCIEVFFLKFFFNPFRQFFFENFLKVFLEKFVANFLVSFLEFSCKFSSSLQVIFKIALEIFFKLVLQFSFESFLQFWISQIGTVCFRLSAPLSGAQ